MTTIEWAGYLNNREYSEVLSREESVEAKKDNIVVAWIPYDGMISLKGAIDLDIIFFTERNRDTVKVVNCITPYNCEKLLWLCLNVYKIGNAWSIYDDIQSESFNILDDGAIYCIGAVIGIDNENKNAKMEPAQCIN